MNDIEKLIEYIEDHSNNYLGSKATLKEIETFEYMYDLLIGTLEKQVAKKPSYDNRSMITHYSCPECGRLYWEKDYIGKYCDECGQKLDQEA